MEISNHKNAYRSQFRRQMKRASDLSSAHNYIYCESLWTGILGKLQLCALPVLFAHLASGHALKHLLTHERTRPKNMYNMDPLITANNFYDVSRVHIAGGYDVLRTSSNLNICFNIFCSFSQFVLLFHIFSLTSLLTFASYRSA